MIIKMKYNYNLYSTVSQQQCELTRGEGICKQNIKLIMLKNTNEGI